MLMVNVLVTLEARTPEVVEDYRRTWTCFIHPDRILTITGINWKVDRHRHWLYLSFFILSGVGILPVVSELWHRQRKLIQHGSDSRSSSLKWAPSSRVALMVWRSPMHNCPCTHLSLYTASHAPVPMCTQPLHSCRDGFLAEEQGEIGDITVLC